jgi:hypothetical protein
MKEKTYHWCKHLMEWGVHPPKDFCLGLSRKDAQRAPQLMTAATAAATIASPSFAPFLSKLLDDKLHFKAACAMGMLALHMAEPFDLDTGQEITYFLLFITPIVVYHLTSMLVWCMRRWDQNS